MEKCLSYIAADGRQVTVDYLEKICTEIGYLLHGSILNLENVSSGPEMSAEHCARLKLSLQGLQSIVDYLGRIFPS